MADIQPFDVMRLLNHNHIEWQDQAAHLDFAGILMAVEHKMNEIILKVNRMDRDQENPLG